MITREQEDIVLNVLRPKTMEEINVLLGEKIGDNLPKFLGLYKDMINRYPTRYLDVNNSPYACASVIMDIDDDTILIGSRFKDGVEITYMSTLTATMILMNSLKEIEDIFRST